MQCIIQKILFGVCCWSQITATIINVPGAASAILEPAGGICDGFVGIEIITPQSVTGHGYKITFEPKAIYAIDNGDTTFGTGFTLVDTTEWDTLFFRHTLTSDSTDTLPEVDGFRLIIQDTPKSVKSLGWTMVNGDTCTFDWRYQSIDPGAGSMLYQEDVSTADDWRITVNYEGGDSVTWYDLFTGVIQGENQYIPVRIEIVTDPGNPRDVTEYTWLGDFAISAPWETYRRWYYSPLGWDLIPGGAGYTPGSLGWYEKHVDIIILQSLEIDSSGNDTIPNYMYLFTNNKPDSSFNYNGELEVIDAVAPTDGDEFTIITNKPFRPAISYTFGTGGLLSIQAAIDSAGNGDTVLVQPGTYVENINFNGKNIVVGSLFFTTLDTAYISQTVIDGDSARSAVVFESGEDSTAILSGFTITHGGMAIDGGGISCTDSSPLLSNLRIIGNNGYRRIYQGSGGGIFFTNSSSRLEDVIISENYAQYGGGVYCYNSDIIFHNVHIINNVGVPGGYAGSGSGAGVYSNESTLTFEYCNLAGNEGFYNITGGGMFGTNSTINLINVTITGNTATSGGGIYSSASNLMIANSIFWNDSPQEIYFSPNNSPSSLTIAYTDIQDDSAGIETNNNGSINWLDGNIDIDPLFCNSDSSNYSLAENSPCIGSGENGMNMGSSGVGCGPVLMVNNDRLVIPGSIKLYRNFPNPFNPVTTIRYGLPEPSSLRLAIYDLLGREIAVLVEAVQPSGFHSVTWNAGAVGSGIYLYQLRTGGKVFTRKLLVVK